jgi:hypothetical protein
MSNFPISTYSAPIWGARSTGTAMIRKDNQARYYVNDVSVADVRVVGLFTVVTCIDDTKHYVLTAFFRLIDRTGHAE